MKPLQLLERLFAGLLAVSIPLNPVVAATTEHYLLKSKGQAIGTVTVRSFDEPTGRITEIENTNRFTRLGEAFDQVSRSRFVENSTDGRPVTFTHSYRIADEESSKATGAFHGDKLDVEAVNFNQTSRQQAEIRANDFYFPTGERIQAVYRDHYNDPVGSRFEYQTLQLALAPQVVNTQVTRVADATDAMAAPTGKPLRKFALRNAQHQGGETIYEWRDAEGKLYRSLSESQGTELVYAAEQIAAAPPEQKPLSGRASLQSVDIVTTSRILTNVIPYPRQTDEALYRLSMVAGGVGNLASLLPQDSWQRVEQVSDTGLLLHVRAKKPTDTSIQYPVSAEPDYLADNAFMQAADPEIASTARQVTTGEKRAYYAARALQRWVYDNVKNKDLSLGFASARETLQRREGDCTEHALLLAALMRAAGIPSRLAVGLVYLPGESATAGYFTYHMWTEAYVDSPKAGGWVAFDATNPEKTADATHIKVADSPLASQQDLIRLSEKIAGLVGEVNIEVVRASAPGASVISLSGKPGETALALPPGSKTELDIDAEAVKSLSKAAIQRYQFKTPPPEMTLAHPAGLTTQAAEQLAQGQYDPARESLQKASQKLEDPLARVRFAERLIGLELYGLAAEELQRAAEADPALAMPVNALLKRALPKTTLQPQVERKFIEANAKAAVEPEVALQLYGEVLAETPRFTPAYLRLGQLAREQGEYSDALRTFQRALTVDAHNPRLYEEIGDTHMAANQYEQAAASYYRALEVARLHPGPLTHTLVLELDARYDIAQGAALVARNPKSSQGWLLAGKGLAAAKRPNEALDALNNALVANPASQEARLEQFRIFLGQSKWPEMTHLYKNHLAKSGSPAAQRLKGLYEIRNRDYAKAVQSLERAIAGAPNETAAYTALAQVYDRLAETQSNRAAYYQEQARKALQRGLTRATSPEAKADLQYELGKRLIESNRLSDATPLVNRLLALDALNPRAHQLAGELAFYRGEWQQARDAVARSLALAPQDPVSLKLMGHIYTEMGIASQAYDYYEKARKAADGADAETLLAMRQLIDNNNLSLKKPPDVRALSKDERAYLVKSLADLKANNDAFLALVNQLPERTSHLHELTVESNLQREALSAYLQTRYSQLESLYRQVNKAQAPAKLRELHFAYAQLCYGQLQYLDWARKTYPQILAGTAQLQGMEASQYAAASQAFQAALERELKTLAPGQAQEVLAESGVQDVSALVKPLGEAMMSSHTAIAGRLKPSGSAKGASSLGTASSPKVDLPDLNLKLPAPVQNIIAPHLPGH